jgi:hypothetical protein
MRKEFSTPLVIMLILALGLLLVTVFTSCASKYGCGSHGRKGYNGRSITGFKRDY